jgi:hypothetical protein
MVHGRRNRFISNVVLAVVFCLMLTTNAGGRGTSAGTISGYILDPLGRAAPGADPSRGLAVDAKVAVKVEAFPEPLKHSLPRINAMG